MKNFSLGQDSVIDSFSFEVLLFIELKKKLSANLGRVINNGITKDLSFQSEACKSLPRY